MDLGQIHKKLADAAGFLAEMIERERQLSGEPFTHYLSAFLTAGMSVRDGFHYLQDRPRNEAIKTWRKNWENDRLTPDEKRLYDCMRELRDAEVHIGRKADAELTVGQEDIKVGVGSSYSDRSGIVQAFGVPSALYCMDSNVIIHKRTYSFKIDGNARKVTEVCTEYLELLRRMVAQYEADRQ